MPDIIDIHHLTREEKLRVMEAIWEDLSRDEEEIESPEWHEEALRETEKRLRMGEERIIDWDDAKKVDFI